MSLLLENAIGAFVPEEAVLVGADTFDEEPMLDEPLALDVLEGYVKHHETLQQDDAVRLPLHGVEDAELTGEYVLLRDHDLRGTMFGSRAPDGGIEWVAADDFVRSSLAARLRFWHPDHVPTELPSYHVSPVAAEEPARNPSPDSSTVLDGLREHVTEERAAKRRENREAAERTPPAERYAPDGDGIPALQCLGAEDGEFVFRVQEAPDLGLTFGGETTDRRGFVRRKFDIHDGNEVLVHAPTSVTTDDFPVRAEVVSTHGRELRLAIAWDSVESRTSVSSVLSRPREGYGLSPLLNPVPYDRQLEAIDALEGTPLASVLAGQEPLTFEDDAKAASDPLDGDLNQDQHLAVDHALLADRLFCIHGPPGTGKTRTLVEFVRRSVQAGRDVLVCADSNQAVDNLLVGSSTADDVDQDSLHAYGQHGTDEFTVHRANARRSSSDLVRTVYGNRSAGNADVVATTNSSTARLAREFDVLVLDEATQATCASSCVPLACAEKVVLAGDHQQLPPYSASDGPSAAAYGHSLFEHVYADGGVYEGVGVQLQTQYRMHRDIAYLPNRLFYDKSLRNGQTIPDLPDMESILAHSIGGVEEQVDYSYRNPTEARFVELLVQRLVEQGVPTEDIGVITPYSAQADLIEQRLADFPDGDAVIVDTIDAFQGSERQAIVISFVRSNEEGDVGFLGREEDGLRRLNVAMTRAKRHCSLVGDWNTLRGHMRDEPTHGCVDTYRNIYRDLRNSGRLRKPDPALLPG